MNKRKFVLVLWIFLVLGLFWCKIKDNVEPIDTAYHSDTSAEDCYLCGDGIEDLLPFEYGQKNVALVSLNTFDLIPIRINRYDRLTGQMDETHTGTASLGGGRSRDDGFFANMLVDYDMGYAMGTIDFNEDEELNPEKLAGFLCEDCLNALLPQDIDSCFGVGVIELSTKDIRVFDACNNHFALGDFEIDGEIRELKKGARQLDIFICYPMRYGKNS